LIQGVEQLGLHLAPVQGKAQQFGEVIQGIDVFLQHQVALVAGGFPGDFWGDGGVAVAIGPDPRAKAAKVLGLGGAQVGKVLWSDRSMR
jgi:hypothetical protein